MERLKDTIIDVEEVQRELDAAARDAISGPADVRAGRFVHGQLDWIIRSPNEQSDIPGRLGE